MRQRAGFSLLEVMIAMALFAIGAMSLTAVLAFTHRQSVDAIYETTAHSVVLGYYEQIMALDYEDVREAFDGRAASPVVTLPLKALSPNVTAGQSVQLDDPLDFSGTILTKQIIVDLRDDGAGNAIEVRMPMRVSLEAVDLATSGTPGVGLEITLRYAYFSPSKRNGGWVSGELCFVKSNVPVF